MDLPLITMEPAEAKRNAGLYRALLRDPKKHHTEADRTAHRAYRALSDDQSVIGLVSIVDAFKRAGVDELGRPLLAFGRADLERVSMFRRWDGSVTFDRAPAPWRQGSSRSMPGLRLNGERLNLPVGTLPSVEGSSPATWEAIAPLIPPDVRPDGNLTGYHVLWEAEWLKVPQPPRDPALLRHMGGDLYAVMAIWDLTEVERLALALR